MEKLRTAMEIAKRSRRQRFAVGEIEASQSPTKLDCSTWVSPDYCECDCLELEPEKAGDNRCVSLFPDAFETESYKVLRTQVLQRTQHHGWNTLMITSARPGEGKTITAINLALTFARDLHQTTLLVDCDLRRQKIHDYLGLSTGKGLADYLLDDRPIQELIVWPGVDSLTLISGGRTIRDSAELIASPKMKTLVAEMKTRYDDRYVFFDVPPLLESADAFTFAPFIDAILMVVEVGRTPINDVKKGLELIPQEKFLGFVLNRHKTAAKSYDNGESRTTIPRFWKRSTEAPAVGKRLLQGMTMSDSESAGDNTRYL